MTASTSSTSGGAWWFMMCDSNHRWQHFLSAPAEPHGEMLKCPVDGAEAVTVSRRPLADRVRVSIVPAAWQDERDVGNRDSFFIEISANSFESETLRSSRLFTWEEAISRIAWFKDIPWESAKKRWSRGGFDKESPSQRA
jgi:hypothetical protein